LKERKPGQNTLAELSKRDMKAELEERERKHFQDKAKKEDPHQRKLLDAPDFAREEDFKAARDFAELDADDDVDDDASASSEDDDEDETAELMRELEKIKRERADEQRRKEAEQAEKDMIERQEALLKGNPLLNSETTFGAKRRWDDDVVFKNQERGEKKYVPPLILGQMWAAPAQMFGFLQVREALHQRHNPVRFPPALPREVHPIDLSAAAAGISRLPRVPQWPVGPAFLQIAPMGVWRRSARESPGPMGKQGFGTRSH